MQNIISKTVTGLIFQGQRAKPGVQANLAALGYSTAQGETFNLRITDTVTARDSHAASLVTLGNSRTALAGTVKTARTVAMTARDSLKPFLGREHGPAWAEAGFVDSFAISRDAAGLLRNVQGLNNYLSTHTEHENPVLNVTAASLATVATDLVGAISALDAAKSTVITRAKDRDAKASLLRTELRNLLAKLRVMFDPFAAIWEQVGFNRPGFISVPAVPLNLTAVLVGPTAAALKWDGAERAERYRIYKKVVGVDLDFVLVETRSELDFVLEVSANATTEVAIAAVNTGGESAKSETVVVVTT